MYKKISCTRFFFALFPAPNKKLIYIPPPIKAQQRIQPYKCATQRMRDSSYPAWPKNYQFGWQLLIFLKTHAFWLKWENVAFLTKELGLVMQIFRLSNPTF